VFSLNLSQNTGCHGSSLKISLSPPGKCQDNTFIRSWLLLSRSFLIHHTMLYSLATVALWNKP
jgi:transposase InsO family protein